MTARASNPMLRSPHALIAAGVAVFGIAQLGGLFAELRAGGLSLDTLVSLSGEVVAGILTGAHRMISGVFAIAMAAGLIIRSRLAWVIVTALLIVDLSLWLFLGDTQTWLALYEILLLALLVRYRGRFDHSSVFAATIFSLGSILMLLAYGVFGTYLLGSQFSRPVGDLGTALYFAVVTMSTVGYGDISPITPASRIFVVSLIVLGITVFATSLSTVLVPLIQNRIHSIIKEHGKNMKLSGHYVIVSQSPLALTTCRELLSRGKAVVFIAADKPDSVIDGARYVFGNANDLDILRKADCPDAEAVLALSEDDAGNAFVVLAAKELTRSPKTVVAVNDARNLERVRRVEPDVIFSPTVLGSELLAMAVTGEDTTDSDLMSRLIQSGAKSG